jgi:hypothetical protein
MNVAIGLPNTHRFLFADMHPYDPQLRAEGPYGGLVQNGHKEFDHTSESSPTAYIYIYMHTNTHNIRTNEDCVASYESSYSHTETCVLIFLSPI